MFSGMYIFLISLIYPLKLWVFCISPGVKNAGKLIVYKVPLLHGNVELYAILHPSEQSIFCAVISSMTWLSQPNNAMLPAVIVTITKIIYSFLINAVIPFIFMVRSSTTMYENHYSSILCKLSIAIISLYYKYWYNKSKCFQ